VPPRRRTNPIERALREEGRLTAGIDEVGRGPLAGPVVACAIIMPIDGRAIPGVADSKLLTPEARERLYPVILSRALAVGVGAASVREIERDNIYYASVRAMQRAVARLAVAPQAVLVDGRRIPSLGFPHQAIVDGDRKCYCIGCASIIAKVIRDRLMVRLSLRYPGFGWEHNAGYATPEHLGAIGRQGATVHHRVTFLRPEHAPNRENCDGEEGSDVARPGVHRLPPESVGRDSLAVDVVQSADSLRFPS